MTDANTQTCPYCQSEIPAKAVKCSQCGEFVVRKVGILLFLGILLLPILFAWLTLRRGYSSVARIGALGWLCLCLWFAFGGSPEQQMLVQETNIAVLSGQTPPTMETLITLAKFNKLKAGMTYEQATSILGRQGEVMSENSIAGTHTVMYQWGNGLSNMNAMFQDGKLIQKAQFGLK